jgi:hypothetical protein
MQANGTLFFHITQQSPQGYRTAELGPNLELRPKVATSIQYVQDLELHFKQFVTVSSTGEQIAHELTP